MWEQYRRKLIPTQLFILFVCAMTWFLARLEGRMVLTIFIVMQISSILGTWWGLRIRRNLHSYRNRLPLDRQ